MNKENNDDYFTNQAFYLIKKMGENTAKQEWTRKKLPLIYFLKAKKKYKDYIFWFYKYNDVHYTYLTPRKNIRL